MSVSHCRLCGNAPLKSVLSILNSPRNIQKLFKAEEIYLDRPIDLSVLGCSRCGFVQIDPLLEEEYYDDYLMTTTHSLQMQDYQQRQAIDFVQSYDLVGKSVKEMGCGDGSYLDHLRAAGALPSGIEPSSRFRELALARGYKVESGYLTATRILEGGLCDGFVTRQVLEHVPDIHGFLTGIRLNLKPGGVGLIEVPSLEKALTDRRFYDFFPDHVNYFSLRTLRLVLELNGFEVIELRQDMFDEYNVAVVRNSAHPDLTEVGQTVGSLGQELRDFIARYHLTGRKVAIWGAGGKGLSVMATAGIKNVDLLVDGDPHKQGLITPVTHLTVEAPSALGTVNVDAVIITAMAYRHEIERTLTYEYSFCGEIAVLGHNLDLVESLKTSSAMQMKTRTQEPTRAKISTTLLSGLIRSDVLSMVHRARASHVGSCFSIADILAVLYGQVMKVWPESPDHQERDRFILSKGHAAAAVYAALANIGMIPRVDLEVYGTDGSPYMTHVSHKIKGVEFSSGSLGHGLPFGVGKALAAKKNGHSWRTFVVLSDGEMDEGSNWEALMFAAHHRLDNLVAIIDYNKLQSLTTISQTLGLEPLVDKLVAFGWNVQEVDGHNHAQLIKYLSRTPWHFGKPSLLLAHTIKGKGVSFMENKVEWHYRSPNEEELGAALAELGVNGNA
jgi:transketolase